MAFLRSYIFERMVIDPGIKLILMILINPLLLVLPFIAGILGIKALIDIKKKKLKGKLLAIIGILLGFSTAFYWYFGMFILWRFAS